MKVVQRLQGKRKFLFWVLLTLLCVYAWATLLWEIPNDLYVSSRSDVKIGSRLPVSYSRGSKETVFASNGKEVYQLTCRFLGVIPVKQITVHVTEAETVIPGGIAVGLVLNLDGVYVAGTQEIVDADGEKQNPCEHILQTGDYILEADGKAVAEKEDLINAVKESDGDTVTLKVRRGNKTLETAVTPIEVGENNRKLGVWIKDDMAGVGTLTYIDADGSYGALGHGISDSETGELFHLKEGKLYESEIVAVNRGEKGSPGELVGMIYFRKDNYLGTIDNNTDSGIFGNLTNLPEEMAQQQAITVCHKQDVSNGPATILADVDGTIRSYEINIEDVSMNGRDANKRILLRVTDEALLKKTGGIVQGTSGSPIIQNGKLVGAVTHVLVNDPTRGYGILAEDMMEADLN